MKVGLSFSRCLLDIVEGRVDIEDVLVIIARTDFDPKDDGNWAGIWKCYGGGQTNIDPLIMALSGSNPEWAGHGPEDEQKFRNVAIELLNTGKLHQPRQFGAHPGRRTEYWLEVILPPSELERNPAAKKAWDNFQVVAELSNIKLDKEYR
jgi:hypothetical protein